MLFSFTVNSRNPLVDFRLTDRSDRAKAFSFLFNSLCQFSPLRLFHPRRFIRQGVRLPPCENRPFWLYYWKYSEVPMDSSQKRAIQNYRSRLGERGLARFEVLGLDSDRDLIRSLARRLADNGPDAARIRATVNQAISGEPPKTGGILAALRRSPLVGADLDLNRPRAAGRKVDL